MDISFFMGIIAGFVLGFLYAIYMTRMVTWSVISVMRSNKKSDEDFEEEEEDTSGSWKPKGWKPDYRND
jgi:CHASE3 domain sensor protein